MLLYPKSDFPHRQYSTLHTCEAKIPSKDQLHLCMAAVEAESIARRHIMYDSNCSKLQTEYDLGASRPILLSVLYVDLYCAFQV